jgi:hypothetical protein
MMNLMEIMQAAQGGNAMDNLARQFGISADQAQSAVAAVMPAMSMGLQRQAESADMMSQFLKSLAGGKNGAAFDEQDKDGDGVPDHLQQQGNDVLGMLFGSKDVSRAVAGQAAQFAGIPDSIIKSMLPVIASMVMGGLFKGMNNQGFGGLLGQIASGMMPGAGNAQAGGGLADILGKMMTGGMMAPQPQAQASNPLGGMLGDMLGGMFGGGQKPAPQVQVNDPFKTGLDALQGMFKTGADVHQNHMNSLQDIFGQMMGAGRR